MIMVLILSSEIQATREAVISENHFIQASKREGSHGGGPVTKESKMEIETKIAKDMSKLNLNLRVQVLTALDLLNRINPRANDLSKRNEGIEVVIKVHNSQVPLKTKLISLEEGSLVTSETLGHISLIPFKGLESLEVSNIGLINV
jgi:hypothetical protein